MNANLTCARCRDVLPEYAAGALSAAENSAIENHLTHCAECSHELAQWRMIVEMARQAETLVPIGKSAAIWSAIQTQLSSESPVVSGERLMEFDSRNSDTGLVTSRMARLERRPQRRTTVMAAVAAVLLITIGAAVFALRPHHTQGAGSVTPTSISTPQSTPITVLQPLQPDTTPNPVAILSANNIWAIGSDEPYSGSQPAPPATSQIVHFDGNHWQARSTYAKTSLRSISMDTATDGWAVGITGANSDNDPKARPFFLHYTGGRWVIATISNTAFLPSQVQMLSATDGWAFGLDGNHQAALHYSDGTWDDVTITLPTQAPTLDMQSYSDKSASSATPQFSQVQMFSDTEGWATGTYQNNSFVWRLHNGLWSASYTTPFGPSFSFGANSPSDAWLTRSAMNTATMASGTGYAALQPDSSGLSALLHFDGNRWNIVQWPADFGDQPWGNFRDGARWLSGPAMDSSGNFKTTVLHNQNGKWSATSLPSTVLDVVSVVDQPDGSTLALGVNNEVSFTAMPLLRYANGTWNIIH